MLKGLKSVLAAALALAALAPAQRAEAYDRDKLDRYGLIRGDLSTWTQRGDTFPENREITVNGSQPLGAIGCSYYASFFMLCRMGIMDPLQNTAWELARDIDRDGTWHEPHYFEPRLVETLSAGRAKYVEKGTFPENYYHGQEAISDCDTFEKAYRLIRRLTLKKGYFVVILVCGTATNYRGEEYYTEGHYVFVDGTENGDLQIYDPAFPGTAWSDNFGPHGGSVIRVLAYELFDANGRQVPFSATRSLHERDREYDESIADSLAARLAARLSEETESEDGSTEASAADGAEDSAADGAEVRSGDSENITADASAGAQYPAFTIGWELKAESAETDPDPEPEIVEDSELKSAEPESEIEDQSEPPTADTSQVSASPSADSYDTAAAGEGRNVSAGLGSQYNSEATGAPGVFHR